MAIYSKGQLTATGNTSAVAVNGKDTYIILTGYFGGGTATVKFSMDGVNYASVGTGGVFTAEGSVIVDLPEQCFVRIDLTGATNPGMFYQVGK